MSRFANSAKEILLLHEIEKLLEYTGMCISIVTEHCLLIDTWRIDVTGFTSLLPSLCTTLSHCMSADNCRVSERALLVFENENVVKLALNPINLQASLTALAGGLLREKNWNKTVNKMRLNVLTLFMERDRDIFARVCRTHYHDEQGGLERALALMESYRPPPELPTGVYTSISFIMMYMHV